MPAVLITGVGGYFGRSAQRFFLGQGWEVIGAGRKPGSDIILDLDEPEKIAALQFPRAIDVIIHAAAAHEVSCVERPLRSAAQNVVATLALLEAAVRNHIPKFVYLSTFHVFGQPSGIINETTTPSPTNLYGLTHLQCEQALEMHARLGRLHGLAVRPANFFGIPPDLTKFDRWTLTPFAFLREGLETGGIVLKTPGLQRRNFVSVESVCRLILRQLEDSTPFRVVHSTGAESYTIRELAFLARTVLEAHDHSVKVSMPDGENHPADFTFESLHPQPAPELTMAQFLGELVVALLSGAQSTLP